MSPTLASTSPLMINGSVWPIAWAGLAAVAAGSVALAVVIWRFYGQGRFVASVLGAWLLVATAAAAAAMINPQLRIAPALLPATIVTLTVLSTLTVVLRRDLRQRADAATLGDWFGLHVLRIYFGFVILAGAALGLLPWAFALAAGLGDLATGFAGAALRASAWRGARHSAVAWTFTLIGMADLLNAGRMGAAVVVPWLLERQLPGILLLLPLFGVPLLLSTHVLTIRHLLAHRSGRMDRGKDPSHGLGTTR
jgi:hypothetical protein